MVKLDNSKVLFLPEFSSVHRIQLNNQPALLQTIQHFKTAVALSDPVRFTSLPFTIANSDC